ncbi:hypothetical protein KTE60_11575 [Burkholderia multivorans]|uniref:gp53-like domain-containing protein n=1 Tax=Burkholderia multivorans TaxID=87883 RepID=UPI001C21D8D3|nr:hypothetical protein [Burkholderia multivorans]MBU9629924.1 hypothetical protein [Burkholderia multivorans]
MDRQIVYAGQIPLETDLLYTNRNAYTALGMLIQDMFGTNTVFSGLGCVPTSPAGMTVNVNPGRVYSLQQRDPTAYSSLGQDTTNQIMKQGVLLSATNFSCPAPATSGYSINYLISASFLEQDTNAVVLPYYNSANPSQAFSGPPVNGQSSGIAQNTTRQDTIQLTLTAGVAAATGSQQTPATPTGQIPLWVVTVAYGQTSITASSISAVAGSPFAPTGGYFQAVGERYSSIINASASQTLTTAALGALVNVTATGTTQTLPAASACPNGTSITIVYMQSSGSATVARNGTDTLSFGQGSSTNSITLNPGEEVQFVSNGTNGWVSAGQTLSTGVTPPQFDNSTKLATTAFVQRALGNCNGYYSYSAATTLTNAQIGSYIETLTNSFTLTLPSPAAQAGGEIVIWNNNSNTVTLSTPSGNLYGGLGSATTTYVLQAQETVTLQADGFNWCINQSSIRGRTAAQFDNSTLLATTAFVKSSLGNRPNLVGINANYTAVAADVGKVIAANSSGLTLTLPLSTSLPVGSVIGAYANIPSGTMSFAVQGSDKLNIGGNGQLLTSASIYYGEGCDWVTDGAGGWYAVGRSAFLGNTGSFAASLGAGGYQKLPSGLIIQWGATPIVAGSGSATVTYPIAFPNAVYAFIPLGGKVATNQGSGLLSGGTSLTTGTLTNFGPSQVDGGTYIAIGR